MQQLTIFDYPAEQKPFQVHDKVRLQLLDKSIDFEIHNHRKYYCEHLIEKIGTVVEVNKNNVAVQFVEEVVLCDVRELEWVA